MKREKKASLMKRQWLLRAALSLLLLGLISIFTFGSAFAVVPAPGAQLITPVGPVLPGTEEGQIEGAVHGYYFYANECPHCLEILEDLILPQENILGEMLDIRLLEISLPAYYEALLIAESHFKIPPSERGIPTLLIGQELLIGETAILDAFQGLVEGGLLGGGVPFPDIEGLNPEKLVTVDPESGIVDDENCETDESCVVEEPLYMAYFYQTGCKECSRVEADLKYLNSQYPQMQMVEFNIYDHADLATWLADRISMADEFELPALFIGDRVLMGDDLLPENIVAILEEYRVSGTEQVWLTYDSDQGQGSIVERFKNMGWLAVVAAGLVDGINPCAFATLIFFVSYLTISGRKGKDILKVGGAFTAGVFLAYLAVGMGLYQILEMIGSALDVIANVVYILTGIFCLVLAVLSFVDYRKAKRGEIGDMMLKLPEPLRKRINATIRKGRNINNYVMGAFGAGILVSFLELACTGQVYLPTIIFVSSIPDLRLQAFFYLVLYNLLFILPLVVIFILVYYGTTSSELTRILREKAAAVKFAMGIVFIGLGGWLLFSTLF